VKFVDAGFWHRGFVTQLFVAKIPISKNEIWLTEDDVAPSLKPTVGAGYTVSISGSMQGNDGMRIEYARNGQPFAPVAFFTNTPGAFHITPNTPGQPESGHIRAVFIKKNVDFGSYSPDYPVTLS